MAVNGIGANYSFTPEQAKNLTMYQKKLDTSHAINFDELPEKDIKTAKDLGINVNKVDLTNIQPEEAIVDVNLKDVFGQDINTTNFDWVINHNWGLNKDEKTTINKAIQSATDVMNKGTSNGDSYGMRISQTNMELKYIGQKFIPEEYRDEYNSYIDQYTKELSDRYIDMYKTMAESLVNTTSDTLIKSGWRERGKDILENLDDGTDVFQTSEREYQKLYNGINLTDTDQVKNQLNTVYNNILTKDTNIWWGADHTSLSSEVKYLAEKWNSFMDVIGEPKNKFTTSIDRTV